MKTYLNNYFPCTILLLLSLFASNCSPSQCLAGIQANDPGTLSQKSGRNEAVKIDYHDNLISIQASNVQLESLLKDVSRKTGIIFTFKNHAIKKDVVNVRIKKTGLFQGIKRILKDYSFTEIQTKDKKYIYTLLGKKGRRSPSSVAFKKSKPVYIPPETSSQVQTKENQTRTDNTFHELSEVEQIEPWQFLVPKEVPCESETTQKCTQTKYVIDKDAYYAARIKRAKKIINAGNEELYPEIISDLSNMRDSNEAKNVLVQLSTGKSKNVPPSVRQEAVQALWRIAGDEEFNDETIINTLHKLAKDPDPAIKSTAENALKDMERYKTRQEYMASMEAE